MRNIKEIFFNDAISKEQFASEISEEIEYYSEPKRQCEIMNAYFEEIGSDIEIYPATDSNLIDIFNNDLADYFENLDHADNFIEGETFIYKKDGGWWNTANTFNDLRHEKIFDPEKCGEYIFEHQAEFEDYFDYDSFYQDLDEEEEEE